MKTIFLTSAAVLLMSFAAQAEDKVKVIDGDSLEINGKNIRLIGIDAPEYLQPCYDTNNQKYQCGQKSLQYLQKLVDDAVKRGDKIKCHKESVDRYKRDLSICYAGKLNLNKEMVRAGWATIYRHDMFQAEEKEAKKTKRGIWQGRFMHPEIYRVLKRYGKM